MTIFLTAGSIYLVFILNEEGPLRILFNLLTFAGIYGLAAIGLNVHFGPVSYTHLTLPTT